MRPKILVGEQHIVKVRDLEIGKPGNPIVMAGPCSIESREQIFQTAKAVKAAGAHILRGGVFKPRTSPYAFQGMGKEGLLLMREAADAVDMPIVTELMDESNLDLVYKYADIIQIGSRNMYNYSLLKVVGQLDKPVLLKRGMSATIQEWILAAEYIASSGNKDVILCERGIRTFDTYTRNTLDLTAVPILKRETGLPVIVDPSHGTGVRELVDPMSMAALACGADGLMIEVHIDPDNALSDGPQSLTPEQFGELMKKIK